MAMIQLGLMASSTPFQSETHAPYTLFYREETLGAGAVGVALVDTSGLPSDIQGNVEYSGLQAVDVPTEVTKSLPIRDSGLGDRKADAI